MDDHHVLGPKAGDDRSTPAPSLVLVLIVGIVSTRLRHERDELAHQDVLAHVNTLQRRR